MVDNQVITTDVVVIGYGAAGAAAAITAHDSGAGVIVLEKMPAGGGNSCLSIGVLCVPKGPQAFDYIEALCFGKTSSEIVKVYVDGCFENVDWLRQLGGEPESRSYPQVEYPPRKSPSWPKYPGVEDWEPRRVIGDEDDIAPAGSLWKLLLKNAEQRGIKVMFNTPAKELITNSRGEVTGVIARSGDKEIRVEAKKAVVLACGGFDYNEAMKDAYLPLTPLYPVGSPGNTGDGIIMAQKVGAAMWHMNQFYGWFVFKPADYKAGFTIRFSDPGYIYVDKDGRRFTTETGWEGHEEFKALMNYMPHRANYPHLPAYAIFDEVIRRKGPLYRSLTGGGINMDYKWSLDNSSEINKGWISHGKNVAELAKRIKVDETILTNTVTKYNEYCKAGKDADFDRSKETLKPLGSAPYYAIEIGPCVAATSGGPRRDKESRVLNEAGNPIPKLYSAGQIGSIFGFLNLGGSGLTEAIVFGRIAGRNAAREKPWS